MADACWSQCRTADWWLGFDKKGWVTCGYTNEYLTGLYRNINKGSNDGVYLIEESRCCTAPSPNENQPSMCHCQLVENFGQVRNFMIYCLINGKFSKNIFARKTRRNEMWAPFTSSEDIYCIRTVISYRIILHHIIYQTISYHWDCEDILEVSHWS